MMPQRESGGPMHEQAYPAYGQYEGDQTYARQHDEAFYEQPLRGEPAQKVYVPAQNNANILRIIVFAIAMVTLIALGVLCLLAFGGAGGWISFCAGSLAIFIIAVVAIDKIK